MDITYFVREFDLVTGGGHSYSLDTIATNMAKRGHNINIVTSSYNIDNDMEYDIYDSIGKTSNIVKEAKSVYSELSKWSESSDIIHIFSPNYIAIAGVYKYRNPNTKIVGRLNSYSFCSNYSMMDGSCHKNCGIQSKFNHSPHDSYENLTRLPLYTIQTYIEPHLMSNLDHLIAISPSVKKIYSEYGVNKEKITIINMPFEGKWNSKNIARDIENNTMFSILYVGRLGKKKGVDILINAIAEISDIHLDVVGDGSEREYLEKLVSDLNVKEKVTFHGYINHDDIPKFYKNSDLFVHPSLWPEPMGRTIFESLQYNLPVITPDVGGSEWVAGSAGKSFKRGDPNDLRKTICRIRSNPELYNDLSNKTQQELERFEIKSSIDSIKDVYDKQL